MITKKEIITEDPMHKKIAPRLRTMKIGDSESYPIIRKTSVESTKIRIQSQFKQLGLKFATRTIDNEIIIQRIA